VSTIAFAGAPGHGKTTLVAALAHCSASPPTYDIVDVPSVELGGAIAGKSIAAAIIVVAATDGPQEFTFEHADLLVTRGVKNIVLFLNKTDLADDIELTELIEMECREMMSRAGANGDALPVLTGSALKATQSTGGSDDPSATTIYALADALEAFAQA